MTDDTALIDLSEPAKGTTALETDERWKLTLRIAASTGLQRAAQLRSILLYISRHAILNPEVQVREHDIACDVLKRRSDFDPSADNIVRVQMSHLRRRLEVYYQSEGAAESLVVSIPKGAYLPHFQRVSSTASSAVRFSGLASGKDEPQPCRTTSPSPEAPARNVFKTRDRSGLLKLITAVSVMIAAACLIFAYWIKHESSAPLSRDATRNTFLTPLVNSGHSTSVVLTDTSLNVIQNLLRRDESIGAYTTTFPQDQLAQLDDLKEREALTSLAGKRSTTFDEAAVALKLIQSISSLGGTARLSYARDLHVRDFEEGNSIIIGSRRANPWALLFANRLNYRFVKNENDEETYYYRNISPMPGQPDRHVPDGSSPERVVGYVDIALTPNLTGSGFVLLIDGSELQATEMAAKFLLYGAIYYATDRKSVV